MPEYILIDTPLMGFARAPSLATQAAVSKTSLDPRSRKRGARWVPTFSTRSPSILEGRSGGSHGIDHVKQILTTFLTATSAEEVTPDVGHEPHQTQRGAEPLLKHCLRKVRDLIIEYQRGSDSATDEYDGKTQVASTWFTELEDHYAVDGGGYSPYEFLHDHMV